MWEAYSLRVVIIQEPNSPPFPEEYIFKTILLMGGTERKTKQNKLFNIHIASYHVSPWPFYSPSHANTHKWGRKGVYDGLQ
jgi:hypothetical protein